MQTEFKEKTYEKYFGAEIARRTRVTFSPDQCDEAFLGFDDAFHLPMPLLRRWLPPAMLRVRRHLPGLSIRDLEDVVGRMAKRMPPFRFNLFVQYKRPEYLSRASANEWSCWEGPYFRYETTPHQQDLLESLESESRGRAATVYASPAFWRAEDLWSHAAAETVIDGSNIANVAKLRGHSRFSYIGAGNKGQGHSDPVNLESHSLKAIIESGLRQPELQFDQHVKRAANVIEDTLGRNEAGIKILKEVRHMLLGDEPDGVRVPRDSVLAALLKIEVFSDALGMSFYAIG